MKKARKLLVTLLVLTFVLSSFSVGFAADTAEKLPTEVVRAQALGILKGDAQGNLNLDKPITRAEALALIIRISGLEKSADLMKGQTRFADVNPDPSLQWATGYINLGVGQNIVNGYPDGTFKGNAQVTYAEMAKMILYAMNYGVTVEGAPWPAGVMSKADDLDIFDKVNALPNVPALRGDVVKMIDNSLTINHLVQTGYGDFKQYEEGDKNFLSKLDVTELKKVKVTEIAKVNSKLDDDEIKLDGDIYTLKADVSAEEIFGLKVDAWVNDDDEVFFVKVKTDEKDILLDTVDANVTKDEVTLKVADDDYKFDEDAVVYVNFNKVKKLTEIEKDFYGKFVLEKGDVIFANLFNFDTVAVVTEVDKNVIEYVTDGNVEDEIDLDDFDAVYVYGPDFKAADVEDIDIDSAIFFWENDDDEIFIIVKNEVVKGSLERIKDSSVKVDGVSYDKAGDENGGAVYTLDEGDSYELWKVTADIEDLADEDVKLVLDLNGAALLISGATEVTSGDMYGIVTYADTGRTTKVSIFTKDGEEVDYLAEDRAELKGLADADMEYLDSPFKYALIKFKLNSDGEIAEEKWTYAIIDGKALATGEGAKYGLDVADIHGGTLEKGADKKVMEVGGKKFYITSDTIVMKALDSKGKLKPEVINTDKFIALKVDGDTSDEAVVFGTENKNAKFIVLLDDDFAGTEEDYFYGVVTDGTWRSGSKDYSTIDVFGEGKADYKVNDTDYFKKPSLVVFEINSKDEAVQVEDVTGSVYRVYRDKTIVKYKDNFVQIAEGTFKIDSGAVIYNLDSKGKLDKKISASKLANYNKISFALEDGLVVAAIASDEKGKAPGGNEDEADADYIVVGVSGDNTKLSVKDENDKIKVFNLPLVGSTFVEGGVFADVKAGAKVNLVFTEGTVDVTYIIIVAKAPQA